MFIIILLVYRYLVYVNMLIIIMLYYLSSLMA